MEVKNKNSGLDILGIQPISKAIDTTVEKSFQGVEGFLQKVCVPALEELGLMIRDKIRNWRLKNILQIIEKSKGKLNFQDEQLQLKIQAHPRVALGIIDNGSIVDNEELQDMWAGLFASSCTKEGQDDENLIFVNLLKQLTIVEAKILNYSCPLCQKILYKNGLISGDEVYIDFKSLTEISGVSEFYRLDRELDHLRTLGLIGDNDFTGGGFSIYDDHLIADITPTTLALNFYVKCQGHNIDPRFYWKEGIITEEEWEKEKEEQAST